MEDLQNVDYAEVELYYNAFMRDAYRSALASLALPPHSEGLDVGCGPGGLFPLLDEVVDQAKRVVGIDISLPHLQHAQQLINKHNLQKRFFVQPVDLRTRLPFDDNSFDWAWSADVLWPAFFEDPIAVLQELRRVVRPGGSIALFFASTSRQIVLPGHDDIEHYLNLAARLRSGHQRTYASIIHSERTNLWLRSIGLHDVHVSTHTADHHFPLNTDVKRYLGDFAFTQYRSFTQSELAGFGMGQEQWERLQTLIHPNTPGYILEQEDYYCAMIGMLAVGRVPS